MRTFGSASGDTTTAASGSGRQRSRPRSGFRQRQLGGEAFLRHFRASVVRRAVLLDGDCRRRRFESPASTRCLQPFDPPGSITVSAASLV